MYCPNCKQEYDGKFCPECGTKLIEKPATSGVSLNLGDANAISGGLHVSDSHAVHNEDKSIHNITNTTSTVNNITQVSAQKTELELLQVRKTQFLNACKRAYEDNVLEQREVVELEELRIKIGLDKTTAANILESVRVMSDRNARKSELNPIAKTKLKILTSNLQKNEVKALMDQIDSLEPLVKRFDHDELSRKYYLVLAALKPEKCIEQKERTKTDTYWEAFWCYLAYIKAGRMIDAEETLASMDYFSSYPEDNMTVLAAAGELMLGHTDEAKEYLNAATGEYTPALQRFIDSIYLLLEPEIAKEMGADENTCAFYLVNFFGQKDPKAKVEEECLRKEKEEAERQRKLEEEQKRKAIEELNRKAMEEAERIRQEEEKMRKAEEEERRRIDATEQQKKAPAKQGDNSQTFSVVLAEVGGNKLQAVSVVMKVCGFGMKEAKDLIDNAPSVIKENIQRAEAESIIKQFTSIGATVTIRDKSTEKEDDKLTDAEVVRLVGENKDLEIKKKEVVDNIVANMVGGFEIIHVFGKNEPYKVCKYLVTQNEWETIMGDNPSKEKYPQFPVTNITYHEAQVFVERVNRYAKVKGVELLIPKPDMQWLGYQKEFAKAFNNSSSKAFSTVVTASGFCWWDGTSSGHLHPVGQLLPSAGIYDACGLVFELCQMKKSEYLHYGAYDQSSDYFLDNSKFFGPIYADMRYDNVGLRLICME